MKMLVPLISSFIGVSAVGGGTFAKISNGTSLSGTSVSSLSEGTNSRNVIIQITNHLDIPLSIGGFYKCPNGRTLISPPSVLQAKTREVAQLEANGLSTSGLLSYKLGNGADSLNLAVVFTLRKFSSNWFGVKWIGNCQEINTDFYQSMYDDDAWNHPTDLARYGYAEKAEFAIRQRGYTVFAKMTNKRNSILQVDVIPT